MTKYNNTPLVFTARTKTDDNYEPSNWIRREILKPQYHEAGHAVVARLTGFRVEWVSIDPAFIDNNAIAIENMCTGFGPVCMTISSDRLNPIVNPIGGLPRRGIRTKEDRETIIGYVIHVLAGPYVEREIDSASFDRTVCERDFGQVAMILSLAEPNRSARKKLLNVAHRRLNKMLDDHWASIQNVARALHIHRTLFGHQIDAIMSGVELPEAA
ncbi:hypothetical protein [Phyllobacterium bourgognense]|uniref:Peptidase M41-like protein n=1 Tax=Phyllobacterium bourgognense TaxID=314236 RepID=A0A368Z569_9HYPH|nr:hypothetical protein [Phyllobacterium bourgognense]RCW87593.1 hypothetical protein C7476_101359 [Phyllobacterium bourgognense]